jgi:hypothetical protein
MLGLLLGIAIVSLVVFVVSSMMMVSELHSRGHRINWFLLRLYIPKYGQEYKRITEAETGRAGTLFKVWLVSINTALVTCIAALMIKLL